MNPEINEKNIMPGIYKAELGIEFNSKIIIKIIGTHPFLSFIAWNTETNHIEEGVDPFVSYYKLILLDK